MNKNEKSEYVVLGWKTDPLKGAIIAFENLKSSDPGADVEQALALGPNLVTVDVLEGKDGERLKREFIETYARVGIRDRDGKYFDPPLEDGVPTYNVMGMAPTGRFHPLEKDRMLYRTSFRVEISANPRRDVERALRLRCTKVSVGVNYERSEEERREQEEHDRWEKEMGEEANKILERRRQSHAGSYRGPFMAGSSRKKK